MCGIAGIFSYSAPFSPVDQKELAKMRDYMSSRGPDCFDSWISDDMRIGLAHRRLSIIDLTPEANQPMCDPETGNLIVFNGEIYNYRQLRDEMASFGYIFRTSSDTEVLLKLYSRYGKEMLGLLRGMFAFAIWDQNQQQLFLARDHHGIKPLYFADNGHTFRFASQVKSILSGGAIDTTPEPAGHVGFFVLGSIPDPFTLYKEIKALLPGHYMIVKGKGYAYAESYQHLEAPLNRDEYFRNIDHREAAYILQDAVKDSLSHHMVSDVPVGIFLSAGKDSSTLAALAREVTTEKIYSITLGFNELAGGLHDEAPMAELISRHVGTLHRTQWISREDFFDSHDHLLSSMDQPTIDGINGYFVAKAATCSGLKVAISGVGGDELFCGYSYYKNFSKLVSSISPFAKIPWFGKGLTYISSPILRRSSYPKLAGLFEYGGDHAGAYMLRRGLYMPWELSSVMDIELAAIGWRDLQLLPRMRSDVKDISNFYKAPTLDTKWYMRNQLLRDTDWASMSHSLEVRTPLVDTVLSSVVERLRQCHLTPNKNMLLGSPKIKLPPSILNRPKTGFSVPMSQWIQELDGSKSSLKRNSMRSWANYVYSHFLRKPL